MDDVRRLREVEPEAARLQGEDERPWPAAVEARDLRFPRRGGQPAVEKGEPVAEPVGEDALQRRADLRVLREDERRLAVGEDRLQQVAEACDLPLPVAYQLQLRQKGEHVALRVLVRPEVGEGRLVVRPLLGRELAVVADLPLRAELGGDPAVRLEPSQHEWLEGAAQAPARRAVRVRRDGSGEPLHERLVVPQYPGVEELFDGPKVFDRVLDRGSRYRHAHRRPQGAHRPRGLGVVVLHHLGLVEDERVPLDLRERGVVLDQQRVAGERDVRPQHGPAEAAGDVPVAAVVQVYAERRGEGLQLVPPVGEQREWRHDEGGALPPAGEKPGYRLYCLAEAHVVREERAEAVSGEEHQPVHASPLVVPQRADEARYGIVRRRATFRLRLGVPAPQVGEKPSQAAVRAGFPDLQGSDVAEAQCEVQGVLLLSRALLERAKRLAQDGAVDFYPVLPEEHQRRPLVEEKAYLVRRDRFARHADGQADPGLSRLRGAAAFDVGGGGDCGGDVHAGDAVPRAAEVSCATADKVFGLRAREREPQPARSVRAEPPQRPPDIRRKAQRPKAAPARGRRAGDGEAVVRSMEVEDDAGPRVDVFLRASAPRLELGREGRAFRVVPGDEPRARLKRHHPRVVQRLVALVLRVFRKARDDRLPDEFVDPVVVRPDGLPAGVPAVVLLHEDGEEHALRDEAQRLTLSRTELHAPGRPVPARRRRFPWPPPRASWCRRGEPRPAAAPPRCSRGVCVGRV